MPDDRTYCESPEPAKLGFLHPSPMEPHDRNTGEPTAKAEDSERARESDVEKYVGLSEDEAAALRAEMDRLMAELEDRHRETLKRLLKVIGTISQYSASEKEVTSVANSTMAWLEKTNGPLVKNLTAESLIHFARLSAVERHNLDDSAA